MALDTLHPSSATVRAAFASATGAASASWPRFARRHVLFLADRIGRRSRRFSSAASTSLWRAARRRRFRCHAGSYVSPLKALSNDIHKNLDVPLSGIAGLANERGLLLPPIRTAVRTGDTPTSERQSMLKHPPHILVTTPESLYILLTAERSRQLLRSVRTVIVDEIHAMADDKRGAHLALSLARLDDLVEKGSGSRPQRIGLSATVRPIDIVARFLAPADNAAVEIIDHGHRRAMDLAVEVPNDELVVA